MMTNTPTVQKKPKFWALIPCGGSGSRAQKNTPKQYCEIAGKPLVLHTLAAFEQVQRLAGVLVVLAQDDTFFADASEKMSRNQKDHFFIANNAGNTRGITVFNGLNALLSHGADANDWVLVHDAARCLITPELIDTLIDACKDDAVGGLLALPLADTLKCEDAGRVANTVNRADKWLAQTPQMFRIGALLKAIHAAHNANETITDEASSIERAGSAPKLVRGSAQNFKVTYPEDFALAEAVLLQRL